MAVSIYLVDLDLGAVAKRLDRPLMLWYALRIGDDTGTGRVSRDQVEKVSRCLRWSPRKLLRTLAVGVGTFWTLAPRSILYLHAAARVAVRLGVHAFRVAYRAPLSQLRGSVATVRARLAMNGIAAMRHGLPISNMAMAKTLRTSERTVRLWKRRARVRTKPNYLLIAPLSARSSVSEFFRATKEPGLRAVSFRGQVWLARQLPNSFPMTPTHGTRSHLRRARRHLRRLVGAPASSDIRGRGTAITHYRASHDRTRPSPGPTLSFNPSGSDSLASIGRGRVAGHGAEFWARVLPQELGGKNVHEAVR